MNENYEMPILPLGSTEGICRGIYKLSTRDLGEEPKCNCSQRGHFARVAPRPGFVEKHFGVGSNVYSVTSYRRSTTTAASATAGTFASRRAARQAYMLKHWKANLAGGGGLGLRPPSGFRLPVGQQVGKCLPFPIAGEGAQKNSLSLWRGQG